MANGITVTSASIDLPRRTSSHLPHFLRNKKTLVGVIIVGFFIVVAIFGPLLAPYSPSTESAANGMSVAPPSLTHLLGTDQLGRDVLSQILVGIRTTMLIGIVTGMIATTVSVLVGVSAGFLGARWDDILSLISNVFLVFPALPFLIVVLGAFPTTGELPIILMLSLLGWPWGARVIRAQTLSLRNKDFVEASREVGEPSWRIILFDIVPNQVGLIAASFVGTVLYAIGASVGLNFLGIGSTSTWSLGTILYWAQNGNALELGAWWWFAVPGVLIALIGTGLVLANFGLDELGNPRLRDSVGRKRINGRLWGPSDPTPVVALISDQHPSQARYSLLNRWTAGNRARMSQTQIAPLEHNAANGADSGVPDEGLQRIPRELASHPVETPWTRRDASALLEIKDLSVVYHSGERDTLAVNHVTLSVRRGEIVGLVGESGSGKSTLAYGTCRLLRPPAVVTSGSVIYRGKRLTDKEVDLMSMSPEELEQLRWREISIVFQSAMNALNPVLRIEDQLRDPIERHTSFTRDEATDRIYELIDLVGVSRNRLRSYPHELSGGMRQRVMIAMALTVEPELVIMDEPTTALDVVVQRDILAQIRELKDRLGFSILFITHDLSLLVELADRLAVMYAGALMEIGNTDDVVATTGHPYTQGLLNSFPPLHGPRRPLKGIPGSPPDLRNPPPGCPFAPRCPYSTGACLKISTGFSALPDRYGSDHVSACPFIDQLDLQGHVLLGSTRRVPNQQGGLIDAGQ